MRISHDVAMIIGYVMTDFHGRNRLLGVECKRADAPRLTPSIPIVMNVTSEGNCFSRRWRGLVPLPQLLWRDIIGIGTLINLVATLLALAAITQGAPSGLAVALHFAPLPYNLFLFGALWRTPGRNEFSVGLAVVWLVLVILV